MNNLISFEEFYESIWLKVPEVWRSADDDSGKALQLLIYTMSQHFYYYFYKKSANIDELFDPDKCPTKYLKFLASMVGWTLVGTDETSWREQIKVAPLLYKIKGTQRGLALAERLVGYSVFISELYRDHLGDLVPKEKIFNNTPENIKTKPWFKSVSLDEYGAAIIGTLESDLFDSYNENYSKLDSDGTVARPNTGTQTRVRALSTTEHYNPVTGDGSLARYAKTPRINVVLRKLEPLDIENIDGTIKDPNLGGALDLLLQFKPFHVYVNSVEVLFDLSDYIFGSSEDPSAGLGNEVAETINYRESVDFSVYIDSEKTEETISYRNVEESSSKETSDFVETLPVVLSDCMVVYLNKLNRETDLSTVLSLGLSVKGSISTSTSKYGYSSINGVLTSLDDFDLLTKYKTGSIVDYVDTSTRTIKLSSLPKVPSFSFKYVNVEYIFSKLYDLNSALRAELNDTSITALNKVNGYISPVTKSGTSSIRLDTSNLETYLLKSSSDTALSLLTMLSNSTLCLGLLDNTTGKFIHLNKFWYRLYKGKILLDTLAIATALNSGYTSDKFLDNCCLYILYLHQSIETDTVTSNVTSRRSYISTRKHSKFTRQYSAISDNYLTSENVKSVPVYEFNETTSTLDLNQAKTKSYRQSPTLLYTRNSLLNAIVDSVSGIPLLSFDKHNNCDKHSWNVYSRLYTSYYTEAEKVSNIWWSDFYQVDEGSKDSGYLVPYLSIDTSAEAQLKNQYSSRWQAALKGLDLANPDHFLATRRYSTQRAAIWNRGSAAKIALPYNGGNRASIQPNRGQKVLFDRTESLTDYSVSITTPSNLSNYKYVLPAGDDVTKSYFNPLAESISSKAYPTTETFECSKLILNPKYESIVSSSKLSTSRYDATNAYADRNSYYDSNGSLHSSLYAGNIVIRNYPNLSGLMYDSLDKLDIMIDGILPQSDTFTVGLDSADTVQTQFNLTYTNLFISWYARNTGSYLNSGAYPMAGDNLVVPNIKVYINGIQVLYNESWSLTLDSVNSVNILVPLSQDDSIRVEYFTLDEYIKENFPVVSMAPSIKTINVDRSLLGSYFNGTLPIWSLESPVICWYDSTGEYLSYGDIVPDTNFDTAFPNIKVTLNGVELKHKYFWTLVRKLDGQVYIQATNHLACKLSISDRIEIKYFVSSN